jgi:hypothetical protein
MAEPEYRNVTEEIDACIREHGGNTRDALNWALGELRFVRTQTQMWKAIARIVEESDDIIDRQGIGRDSRAVQGLE